MQVNFQNDAQEKIQAKITGNPNIILDLDDGVGPYSSSGSCTLGIHFKLIFEQGEVDTKTYDGVGESELGTVYYKKYSETYLSNRITISINKSYGNYMLDSAYELIDGNLELVF